MNNPIPQAKTLKKLTLEIVDEKALAEAYPEVMREIKEIRPDRAVLYPIAKAMFEIGRQLPGVKAYYASDETASNAPETGSGEAKGDSGAVEGGAASSHAPKRKSAGAA